MSEPVNPYAPPPEFPIDAAGETTASDRHPFVDAFTTGTRLFVANIGLIAAVVCTVWLPLNLWLSYQEHFVLRADDQASMFQLNSLADGLVGVVAHAATLAIGVSHLRRERLSYPQAMSAGLRQWARFVFGNLVSGFCIILGLLLLVVPGVYVMVCTGYLFSVLVVEELPFWKSFRRCFAVGDHRFWISLGIMLVAGLIEVVVVGGLGMALGIAVYEIFLNVDQRIMWVIDALIWLPMSLIHPWGLLVVLAAYDRIRREEAAEEEAGRWNEGPAKPEAASIETQREGRETMNPGE